MNRTQLVDEIAQRLAAQAAALPKARIEAMLSALQDTVTDPLRRGESVTIAGWGTWRVEKRAARQVRIPNREVVSLKPTRVPKWQAGTRFREAIASGKNLELASKDKS
jgi:DNA-binding protein HU-beta